METTQDSPHLITAISSFYRLEPVLRNACGSAGFLFCPFDAETRGGTTIRHRHQEEPGDTARHNATHAIVSSEIAALPALFQRFSLAKRGLGPSPKSPCGSICGIFKQMNVKLKT